MRDADAGLKVVAIAAHATVVHMLAQAARGGGGDELLAHCRANLARYKIPARIRIVEALPKTSVAKTDKNELRKWSKP